MHLVRDILYFSVLYTLVHYKFTANFYDHYYSISPRRTYSLIFLPRDNLQNSFFPRAQNRWMLTKNNIC